MTTEQIEPEQIGAGVTEEDPRAGVTVSSLGAERRTRTAPGARRRLRWGALALAVAVLASGLFAWWRTVNDDRLAMAETRDQVLVAARGHIETMNTMDYRAVDEGLQAWAEATTGTLHDQLVDVGDDQRQLLEDQGMIATGEVIDAAVLELEGDTATVIASLEVTVREGGSDSGGTGGEGAGSGDAEAEPEVKRNRFSADLARVQGEWKLESLEQVAVSTQ